VQVEHKDSVALEAGLQDVQCSPADNGEVKLIVSRPAVGERLVLPAATLDLVEGLIGDTWSGRPSTRTPDGSAHPDMQLNVMSSRAVALMAGGFERWPLAGDQLYVDLDLSEANLPPGSRLKLGSAIIEVTDQPHLGCAKFAQRFGRAALSFVNSPVGRQLRLRGLNAKVVLPGTVRVGDVIRKLEP
jgi:hypothetical protein